MNEQVLSAALGCVSASHFLRRGDLSEDEHARMLLETIRNEDQPNETLMALGLIASALVDQLAAATGQSADTLLQNLGPVFADVEIEDE